MNNQTQTQTQNQMQDQTQNQTEKRSRGQIALDNPGIFNYRPLPNFVELLRSRLHDARWGLYAKSLIFAAETIGISHILINSEIFRTPLGGFYNHSDTPNCHIVLDGNRFYLKSLQTIEMHEELTVKYSLHNWKRRDF